ncbi:MAG: leucyl aminopeptidase family protein [Bdellovibrionaceae bacterium]|nr:leucyl aminopeptidase family protein [Pseudobdellovibrionaceae bacterium]
MNARILFCSKEEFSKNNYKVLNPFLSPKNKSIFLKAYKENKSTYFLLKDSFFFLCLLSVHKPSNTSTDAFCSSDFSEAKNKTGDSFSHLSKLSVKKLSIFTENLNTFQSLGVVVGAYVASYKYKKIAFNKLLSHSMEEDCFKPNLKFTIKGISSSLIKKGKTQAYAINMARHLVNLPPNILNTDNYANWIQETWKGFANTKVSVWDNKKLKKEKMNLLLAVGEASACSSYLVKISYRGAKNSKTKTLNTIDVAFVGKGIVFDSGGLGIKPAGAMRLMKKDMGGSASVLGLAYWVANNQPSINCDFYIPIAENSISGKAFRPGDVYQSRSGKLVEIHHTDAEGRLILADALSLAVESKPKKIINIATLTGATRVALGYDVGGLYSNHVAFTKEIVTSAQQSGEALWPMPMVKKYKQQLSSNTADISHAADGMAGGIRAALFLEEFIQSCPWVHLDIYAWQNSPQGALLESGGSGQAVQSLIYWLENKLVNNIN